MPCFAGLALPALARPHLPLNGSATTCFPCPMRSWSPCLPHGSTALYVPAFTRSGALGLLGRQRYHPLTLFYTPRSARSPWFYPPTCAQYSTALDGSAMTCFSSSTRPGAPGTPGWRRPPRARPRHRQPAGPFSPPPQAPPLLPLRTCV